MARRLALDGDLVAAALLRAQRRLLERDRLDQLLRPERRAAGPEHRDDLDQQVAVEPRHVHLGWHDALLGEAGEPHRVAAPAVAPDGAEAAVRPASDHDLGALLEDAPDAAAAGAH